MSEQLLDYAATLRAIEVIHHGKPRGAHPLWIALMNGALNRQQVALFLRQFSVVPLYNHNYHGPLYVNCPDPRWRQRMANVVYEEGAGGLYAGGVPHYQLYLRVGEAFGVSPEEMYATEFCAGALGWQAYFENASRRSFLEGFATLSLGGEAQVPGVSGKVSEAMVRHYGLTAEQAAFYTVHEEADRDHSGGALEFLQAFARSDADLRVVIRAVRGAVEVSWLLYQDIWQLVQDGKQHQRA